MGGGSSTTVSDTRQQCTQARVGVAHKPLPPWLRPELRGGDAPDPQEAERENTTAHHDLGHHFSPGGSHRGGGGTPADPAPKRRLRNGGRSGKYTSPWRIYSVNRLGTLSLLSLIAWRTERQNGGMSGSTQPAGRPESVSGPTLGQDPEIPQRRRVSRFLVGDDRG